MAGRRRIGFLAVALVFALVPVAQADHLEPSPEKTRVKAKLQGTPGHLWSHGHAKRNTRVDITDFQDRFKGKASISYPLNEFGIDTPAEAAAADVRLELSRNGAEYAECFLALDDDDEDVFGSDGIDDGEPDGNVSWRVDLRFRNGALEVRRGFCVPEGIPDAQPGDVAAAVIGPFQEEIAVGTFKLKSD